MEFRLLGPLDVRVGDGRVPLQAPKLRTLLAILLVHANEPVARDVLIEELWAERPPATAAKILKTYVSQLRRSLGRDVIVTAPSAYELRADPASIDVRRFEQLIVAARSAAAPVAAETFREGLDLWRGPALADFSYEPWAQVEINRLEELRLEALEGRIDAELALGESRGLIAELRQLVAEHPLRERLRGQLMLALYRSGRQADALAAYRDARVALVEALAIEPGIELRQLERAILEQDPELDVRSLERDADRAERRAAVLRGGSSLFVGRRRELQEVRALCGRADVRLVTLTGTAGSGKTRLALEAVRGHDAEVVLVELAPITDPDLVAKTLADTLGVRERPGRSPDESVVAHLRDRRALLLLDNFEQVLAAAPLLATLLDGAPGVRLLVTSRTPVGIPEERVYPVPPLALPDPGRPWTPAELRRTDAIRLFVERTRQTRPDFALSDANADAVARICIGLDGLPLALELAAARGNVLSPRGLLDRLGQRLDMLTAQPGSGLAERHQTLRAAIEWSYDLLEPDLQELFTRLAIFVGGFSLDGAEAVAADRDVNVLAGVEALLRSNLLTSRDAAGGEPRVGMLETIREYALDRLAQRGDGEDVRRRHAGFYAALAEAAEPGLSGPDQPTWVDRLDAERDNLRAAMDWARASGEAEVGLRIAAPLWRFWNIRNGELEARRRIEELLAIGSASPATTATAQAGLAALAHILGDHETVRRALSESLPVHRREGNDRWTAHSLGLLSNAALFEGDIEEALLLAEEELETARRAADPTGECFGLFHLGVVLAAKGELADAERALEEGVQLATRLGNARTVAQWTGALGVVALLRGDYARARSLLETSLAEHQARGDTWSGSRALLCLAYLALESGDDDAARSRVVESLASDRGSDHERPQVADDLEMAARLAAARGRLGRAVTIYGGAALLRESVGVYALGVWFWPDPAPHIAELRSALGDAEFEQAWARGRAMTTRDAIDDAIDCTNEPALTGAAPLE